MKLEGKGTERLLPIAPASCSKIYKNRKFTAKSVTNNGNRLSRNQLPEEEPDPDIDEQDHVRGFVLLRLMDHFLHPA